MLMRGFICLILFTPAAWAQNCEGVIALSKTVQVEIRDQQSVESAAAEFCSAYSKHMSSGSSNAFSVGYGPLSASFGGANADAASVASKYCSTQDGSKARSDAYRNYVESISPNAYHAYETCVRYSQQALKFSVDETTVLPEEFTIIALFDSNMKDATTTLAFAPSSDVTCAWAGGSKAERELKSGATAALTCQRRDAARKSYVKLFSPDIATDPLSIPWGAYTKQGISVDLVNSLQQRNNELEAALKDLRTRVISLEGRKVWSSAKPSLGNSKRWSDTGSKSKDSCGEGFVSIGLDQSGQVACAPIELVP